MQSKGHFFYVKKTELKQDFTQIPNQIFDLELTAIEKLILIYLFSNAETFRITKYRIEKTLNAERRTVKKAMAKLKELQFINNINEFTIEININKIIEYTSNSTGSNLTGTDNNIPVIQPASNSTSSNLTSTDTSNSTGTLPVIELVHTSNSTPIIPVEIHNNNTKQNEIKKEEKKKEQKEEKISFSDLNFSSENYKKEIDNYIPIYFSIKNHQFLFNTFLDFKFQTQNTKINLESFEKLLFTQMFFNYSQASGNDTIITNEGVNNYILTSNFTIPINELSNLIKIINSKPQIKELYRSIIEYKCTAQGVINA